MDLGRKHSTSKAMKDRTKILMFMLIHNSNRCAGKKYGAAKYTGIVLMEEI